MEKQEKKLKEGIQLTIIEKIEALMDEHKVNQATLAREINIGQAQLSKCLNRKGNNYIGIDTLIRISDYFRVPVDHLLGRTTFNSGSKARSNTDICRNLVNLSETNSVNILSGIVEENVCLPGKESDENPTHQNKCEKKKNTYKMFYFSNFEDDGQYHPKGIEINAFIEYYLKLRELNKKNDLPKAFFEQAIEDRLNQMRY